VRCGEKKGPFYLENNDEVKVGACAFCSSEGPFKLNHEEVVYRNF
jgi:DNA replication licensing factor MCM2